MMFSRWLSFARISDFGEFKEWVENQIPDFLQGTKTVEWWRVYNIVKCEKPRSEAHLFPATFFSGEIFAGAGGCLKTEICEHNEFLTDAENSERPEKD